MRRRVVALVGAVALLAGLVGCAGSSEASTVPVKYDFAVLSDDPQVASAPKGSALLQLPLYADAGFIRVLRVPDNGRLGTELCSVDLLGNAPSVSGSCEVQPLERSAKGAIDTVNLLVWGLGGGSHSVDVYVHQGGASRLATPSVARLSWTVEQ